MTDGSGNLIVRVWTNNHFKIKCPDGTVIEIRRIRKSGSSTFLSVIAPKNYKIERFYELIGDQIDVNNTDND